MRPYLMDGTSWSKGALQWIIGHRGSSRRGGIDGHTPFDVNIGEEKVGSVDGHDKLFDLTVTRRR